MMHRIRVRRLPPPEETKGKANAMIATVTLPSAWGEMDVSILNTVSSSGGRERGTWWIHGGNMGARILP
jgi:hypothetical protein